jgi:sarcosine oxidase
VSFDRLDGAEVVRRWPHWRLDEGTVALYQAETGIVDPGRGNASHQRLARTHGARHHERSPVSRLTDTGGALRLELASGGSVVAGQVVLAADAWTNELLDGLGARLPLTITQEQVTWFAVPDPSAFAPDGFPVWIWMDDPSFYGFPTYGEATVKAAQDCGGPPVDPDDRGPEVVDAAMLERLARFIGDVLPGSGDPVRSRRCLYTLTPDRDLVLAPVPGHERIVVGMGAAHGFKFAPTFGRLLAELSVTGTATTDLDPFRFDRPALTDPAYVANWIV